MPSKYQGLVEGLSGALASCEEANSTMHRRKLGEAKKRIAGLYELLAHDAVTPEFVSSLQSLTTALTAKDYATALNWHAYLLKTANVATAGTGLLGIKTLITVAKAIGR